MAPTTYWNQNFRGQMRYVWIWDFEIRSIDAQLRVVVCSSIIVASLQMLDDGRCFPLVEKVRKFSKHLLREVTNLLVRPSSRLGHSKDRRELPRSETTALGTISFRSMDSIRSVLAIAVAWDVAVRSSVRVSIADRRHVEVQVQSDSEQS